MAVLSRPGRSMDRAVQGFTLVETMVAAFVLSFGLMVAGELIALAARASSLARAKGNAAILAESKLVHLEDLYRRDPNAPELSPGDHGPEYVQVWNRAAGRILDRYAVSWKIVRVSDPRPGRQSNSWQISIMVLPVDRTGVHHLVNSMNKPVIISAVLSSGYL